MFIAREGSRILKSSWCYLRFLIHFSIHKKWCILCLRKFSSPVKASNFNPLNPDLLTLYRRPNTIKIWPTYAVPPTTTLRPRSTYDLWRAGSSPTIFQPVENLSRSPRPPRAGPINPRCILDQHTLSPIKARSLPIRPFFPSGRERGLIDSLVWTGLKRTKIWTTEICFLRNILVPHKYFFQYPHVEVSINFTLLIIHLNCRWYSLKVYNQTSNCRLYTTNCRFYTSNCRLYTLNC